jgi:hypothetical protein
MPIPEVLKEILDVALRAEDVDAGVRAYIYMQDFNDAVVAERLDLGLGDEVPSLLEMAALLGDTRGDVDVAVERWQRAVSERRGSEAEGERAVLRKEARGGPDGDEGDELPHRTARRSPFPNPNAI